MKKISLILCAISFLPMLASAGTLYNIQFSYADGESKPYRGAAQVGAPGDQWNYPNWIGVEQGSTNLFTGIALVDAKGADGGVTATLTSAYNSNATWNDGNTFNHYKKLTGGGATMRLMDTLVKVDRKPEKNSLTLTLNGLPDGTNVTVYVYGSGAKEGQGGAWSLAAANGGDSAIVAYDGSETGRDITLASSQGVSWEKLSGQTDSTGSLVIIAQTPPEGVHWQIYMNGLQVQVGASDAPVPAPVVENIQF